MAEEEGGTGVEYEIEVTILESNLPMLHDSLTRENITIEKYPDLEIGEYGKIYFNSIHTAKGHIKPKAVWARRRFSQKMNKRICFVRHELQESK